MKLTHGIAACALAAAVVGCNQGTSTAPGTSRATNRSTDETARKLTVTVREDQVITQNLTDEVTVMIDRDNFSGPVDIKISDLPSKVSVVTDKMSIPADKDSLTVTLKADADAPPVTDHLAKVSAKAADMPEASTTFKLTVNTM
jgi:hypothetical protein